MLALSPAQIAGVPGSGIIVFTVAFSAVVLERAERNRGRYGVGVLVLFVLPRSRHRSVGVGAADVGVNTLLPLVLLPATMLLASVSVPSL